MFLILFLIADVYLIVFAIQDLNMRDDVVGGDSVLWLLVIILFSPIGSIIYLVWSRQS